MTSAFHRSYVHAGKRAGQVTRLHILRTTPVRRQGYRARDEGDWPQGLCGISAGTHTKSEPILIDPMPRTPPNGLTWCPHCLGRLADQLGFLELLGEMLADVQQKVAS